MEIDNLLCCDQNCLIEPLSVAPTIESRKSVQYLLEFPLTRGRNEIEVTRTAGRSGCPGNSNELPLAPETALTMCPE